ncbi:MAG: von Willebrand factor type A domain-containing protein [Planctomycetota bacterium]|nr:von Willebrand factor type A domain-containing protein [Planctomycetota bacterium]
MSTHQDDPRITTYVLDEMDAAERAAFEQELAGDAALAAEVEAFRALTGDLELALAPAPDTGLAPLQRTRVEQAATTKPASRAMPGWMLVAALVLGIGVSVGLAALWPDGSEEKPDESGTYFSVLKPDESGAPDGRIAFDTEGDASESAAPMDQFEDVEELPSNYTPPIDSPEVPAPPSAPLPGVSPSPVQPAAQSDNDLPFEETAGRSASTAPAPFEGPSSNGTIGIAGGSGGSFKGRGGYSGPTRIQPSAKVRPAALPGGGRFGGGVPLRVPPSPGSEAYDRIGENPFLAAVKHHTSTFSLDVDTASYANVRRFLMHQGVLPPPDAVRIEELVNYFTYDYAAPREGATHPFATHADIAACPWNDKHLLARVAVKGKVVANADRPAANLVFLVDVSGSMEPANKLPLVKQGLRLLLEKLDARDKVAIVTYAGQAAVALPSTSCAEKEPILAAIDKLSAGGSTNGEAGIDLAYTQARRGFVKGGINRVLLATDGDFNVGNTSRNVLIKQIKQRAKAGTYLSILGFGMGNYKDGRMEALSNACNGTYAYIDSLAEAKKVLVEGLTGQLVPIAKDVKVQVFFNPKTVQAYRLIGYENRRLAAKDFKDDTKDAGDVGAGHNVTAFYEIVPVGQPNPGRAVDPNPFVDPPKPAVRKPAEPAVEHATALFQLRLRYQPPEGGTSTLIEQMVEPTGNAFDATGNDFRFASAVAAFGMKLRRSPHQGRIAWDAIIEIAESAIGEDPNGRRSEFLQMVKKAKELMGR